MSPITRTWLAFAAIGTGLIHLALVISSPLPLAIVLALFGLAEFGWGVVTFARDSIAAPRLVLAGALAPVVLWALLVASGAIFRQAELGSSLNLGALGVATLFELFVAITIAAHLRRGTDLRVAAPMPSAIRYLGGLLVGGLLVGALVTPALSATEAGAYAQPHGEHSDLFVPRDGGHTGH